MYLEFLNKLGGKVICGNSCRINILKFDINRYLLLRVTILVRFKNFWTYCLLIYQYFMLQSMIFFGRILFYFLYSRLLIIHFLKFLFIYLFIYGCVGSSFLCEGFLKLWQAGATLHHGARASHYRGLSCCGAQAPDAQAQ